MQYMEIMVDLNDPVEDVVKIVSKILLAIAGLFEIFSPFTKFGLYVEHGKWQRSLLSAYNIFYVYAYFGLVSMVCFHAKRIIKYVRTSMIMALAIDAAIMIHQCTIKTESFTVFTYILPVIAVMVLLHSKPFDDKTDALGLASLDSFLKKHYRKNVQVDFAVLKLNIPNQNSITNELGKILNSFWHDSFKNAAAFNLTSDIFVLAVPKEKRNGKVAEKLNKLPHEEFNKYYEMYRIPYKLFGMYDVDFIETSVNILGVTKLILPVMEENSIIVLDENKKAELRVAKKARENLADIANQKNMDDPRVLVYCQPIRNMATGKYDTAEALMK